MFGNVCDMYNRCDSSGGRPLSGEGFSNNLIIAICHLQINFPLWKHLCSSVKAVEAHSYCKS